MTTESQPHVVYDKSMRLGAVVTADYAEAYKAWQWLHSEACPFLIATLGRVIDPAQPIIDCNEGPCAAARGSRPCPGSMTDWPSCR
jgi:hypothetical protein